jgi:hypothetical protein
MVRKCPHWILHGAYPRVEYDKRMNQRRWGSKEQLICRSPVHFQSEKLFSLSTEPQPSARSLS